MADTLSPAYVPEVTLAPPPWADDAPPGPRITGVRCIVTAPEAVNLVVVKVYTSDDGLYGVGCATFTQRAVAVRTVIEEYLAPLIVGRDPADITDIVTGLTLDSYWRNGPVLNNAIAGIDMALWDIAAKRAGVPVWQLLGGRVREYVATYAHATGSSPAELTEQVQQRVEAGYGYVRCQVHVPGSLTYGAVGDDRTAERQGTLRWNSGDYLRYVPKVFARLRGDLPESVGLIHDVHERVSPAEAVTLVRALDEFRLHYVEDPLAPEDIGWLPRLREQTTSPLALGELFVTVNEYLPVIQHRLVDFIRCHVSAIGGLTPAWRLASLAEMFGVRTAWHGPRDVSPIGHATNLALAVAAPAFGIAEHHEFSDAAAEVFPGTVRARRGRLYPSYEPGLGIDIDERAAAAHPPVDSMATWHYGRTRRTDGTVQRP